MIRLFSKLADKKFVLLAIYWHAFKIIGLLLIVLFTFFLSINACTPVKECTKKNVNWEKEANLMSKEIDSLEAEINSLMDENIDLYRQIDSLKGMH